MNILRKAFTVIFMIFAYSSGRVIFRKKEKIMPGLVDLIILTALWVSSLIVFPDLSPFLLGGAGFVIGFLLSFVLPINATSSISVPETPVEGNILKQIWETWKNFAFRLGNFQARIILGYFYFTILVPFGIFQRLRFDPLNIRLGNKQSLWFEYEKEPEDIHTAGRQY